MTAGPQSVPPIRFLASSLTPRGWGLVGAAGLSAVSADLFGIGELYAVAAAAGVLVLYAVGWSWSQRWRVDVGRRMQPGRVEAGGGALVLVTLHNRSRTTSPVLTLRDPLDRGRLVTSMFVAPMAPGQRISGTYRLPPAGRGVFTLGPLALEACDPLGLARRTRASSVVSTYIVHPRVERLRAPRVAAGPDRNRGSALPIAGQGNDEFSSLREYRHGDDMRRMHWVSTARTDTLMVRENQLERLGQFTMVLDTRRESWSAATFERAVSAAASIGSAALEAGLHVRLLTTEGVDSGSRAGRPHREHMLDMLAEIRVDNGGRSTSDPAPTAFRLDAGGTAVVVTSDSADADELRRTLGIRSRDDLILVVIGRSSSPSAPIPPTRRAGSSGRVVRVGPDTPLAAVWDPIA